MNDVEKLFGSLMVGATDMDCGLMVSYNHSHGRWYVSFVGSDVVSGSTFLEAAGELLGKYGYLGEVEDESFLNEVNRRIGYVKEQQQ